MELSEELAIESAVRSRRVSGVCTSASTLDKVNYKHFHGQDKFSNFCLIGQEHQQIEFEHRQVGRDVRLT